MSRTSLSVAISTTGAGAATSSPGATSSPSMKPSTAGESLSSPFSAPPTSGPKSSFSESSQATATRLTPAASSAARLPILRGAATTSVSLLVSSISNSWDMSPPFRIDPARFDSPRSPKTFRPAFQSHLDHCHDENRHLGVRKSAQNHPFRALLRSDLQHEYRRTHRPKNPMFPTIRSWSPSTPPRVSHDQ